MKLSVICESEGLDGINVSPGLNPAGTPATPLAPRHDTGASADRYTQRVDRPDLDASDARCVHPRCTDTDGDYTDYDSDDYNDEDDPSPGRDEHRAASTPPIIARLTAALRAKGLLEHEIAGVIALVERHMRRHRVSTLSEELVGAIVSTAQHSHDSASNQVTRSAGTHVPAAVGPRGIRGVIERRLGDRIRARVRRKLNKNPQLRVPHPELRVPHPEHPKLHETEEVTGIAGGASGATNITDRDVLGIAGHPVTPGLFNTTKHRLDDYDVTSKTSFDNFAGDDDDQPTADDDTDARYYHQPVTVASVIGAVGDVVSDVGELIGSRHVDQYYNVSDADLPEYRPVRQIDTSYDRYRSINQDEIEEIEDIERESRDDYNFNCNCDVATLCDGLVTGSPHLQDELWYQEYQGVQSRPCQRFCGISGLFSARTPLSSILKRRCCANMYD